MIDIFGYIGLSIGLFAITKKQMTSFRIWHIASSISYIVYGIMINAYPIIISGSLFVAIHIFNLYKHSSEKILKDEN